ncbi:hypothetical protein SAQUA_23105 [Serratia aquatilis]
MRSLLKRPNRKTRGYSISPEIQGRAIGTFTELEYYV